jgi:hypothetical protein
MSVACAALTITSLMPLPLLHPKGCWEITGCNTNPGAGIGTGYGCKPLPKSCANLCECNGAWAINSNRTITSVMDGMCLESDGKRVTVGKCISPRSPQQTWNVVPSSLDSSTFKFQQGSLCIDSSEAPAPPTPPAPNPGPGGAANVSVHLASLKLGFTGRVRVRDVWNHRDLPTLPSTDAVFTTHVPYVMPLLFYFTSTMPCLDRVTLSVFVRATPLNDI